MSDTQNSPGVLGFLLLLLILGGQGNRGGTGGLSTLGGLGNLSTLGKSLQLEHFARDMHRVVSMMDQMQGLKQAVGAGQLAAAAATASSPAVRSQPRITGAANSVNDAFADAFGALNGQDLSQLMELAGPLMSMLNSQDRGYSK